MKRIGLFSLSLVLIDQVIKNIVAHCIKVYDHVKVIPHFFYIAHVHNTGAAWSILSGNRYFLVAISVIAIVVLYLFFVKDKKLSWYDIICYSLLFGGIIGNLIDRVVLGYVVDYLEFIFGSYNYPVFNFADMCIVGSIILIIIKSIREDVCKRKKLK